MTNGPKLKAQHKVNSQGDRGKVDAFSDLNPAARVIWAKSGGQGGHGLLAHMLDVAPWVSM